MTRLTLNSRASYVQFVSTETRLTILGISLKDLGVALPTNDQKLDFCLTASGKGTSWMEQGGAHVKEQRHRKYAKLRAPGQVAICVPVCLGMGIGSRKHSASHESWLGHFGEDGS